MLIITTARGLYKEHYMPWPCQFCVVMSNVYRVSLLMQHYFI